MRTKEKVNSTNEAHLTDLREYLQKDRYKWGSRARKEK
jgi:hypothetical protein